MLNSVRVRLTLWYSAVLTCVLLVLAIATYVILRQNAMRRTDSTLAELAESFLTTVNAELRDESGSITLIKAAQEAISEHNFRDFAFSIFDKSGRTIIPFQNLLPAKDSEDGPPDVFRELIDGSPQPARPFQNVQLDGNKYRGYARRFSVSDGDYVLVVLQSLHRQEEFLESVTQTFSLVIPLAVLLASVGGYFLARRSLSPVVAMSKQAGRIGEANLHDRLSVQNKKDELGHLAHSFNDLLDRLDQSFERQRRFVADASHELRTPIAILCGEAEVALSQHARSAEDYRESLDILRAEAKRLKHIVEDLFTLARADAGQYSLTTTEFYLDELAADCSHNVRTLGLAKQITLHCEAPKEMPICADEVLLRRLIMNLLDNAIKHTPRGGSVSIACGYEDSQYALRITDTGQGIPIELQPRIFERFFRADKVRARSESDGGGAGLGLSIGRWIAEAHHGRLELTHSGPMGSTFTVLLPISSKAAQPAR
jgi:two-component system OmpR family sensor kinase